MSEIQVGQINSTDGSTAITTGADGYVSFAKTQIGGRRNLIINGAMQVAQRGTSATTMTSTYATVDRFRGFSNGSGAFTGEQYSMSNTELSTTGHSKALKMLVSTADSSIDAADYYALQYKFEGDDLQHLQYGSSSAKSFTVSFWAKSDTAGTYFLTVDKIANGQTAYRLPIEYTISNADTWEYKTLTISPTAGSTSFITSSAGAIGGGTGHGLSLYFGFAWGTNYHGTNNTWAEGSYGTNASANGWMSTVGNDFYITGVQLEVGPLATPFEHRSYGEELALCQRYYETGHARQYGSSDGTLNIVHEETFKVQKRTTPTMTNTSWTYARSGANGSISVVNYGTTKDKHGRFGNIGATWVVGHFAGDWTADAEV